MMKDYRVNVAIGDFSFYVQAWDKEDAKEEAEKKMNDFIAIVQNPFDGTESTQAMWITDIEEE